MLTIRELKERIQECRDDEYEARCHVLKCYLAGVDPDEIDLHAGYSHADTWREYPEIRPGFLAKGRAHHALVAARVSVQSVVYADPEFQLECNIPLVKEVQAAWLKKRWEMGRWQEKFYQVGMSVEACGVGFVEHGLNDRGFSDLEYRDAQDIRYDPIQRSPSAWRYIFRRARLPFSAAMARYGDIVGAEALERLASQRGYGEERGRRGSDPETYAKIVYEYAYYDVDTNSHCIILGDLGVSDLTVLVLTKGLDGEMEYVQIPPEDEAILGPNPFLALPFSAWVDSWNPGMSRPVGKLETVFPIAEMLRTLETYLKRTLGRGMPFTIINGAAFDNITTKALKDCTTTEQVAEVLVAEGIYMDDPIKRIDPLPLPSGLLLAIQYYKDQLRAATGVDDAQLGEDPGGRKSAFEARQYSQRQGVQARHTRKQYAAFLAHAAETQRRVGAAYEVAPDVLFLTEGKMDLTQFKRRPFLGYDSTISVREDSLQYKTEEEILNERIALLSAVDIPAIQMGVADPVKIFADVFKAIGRKDLSKFMVDQAAAMASSQEVPPEAAAMAAGVPPEASQAQQIPPSVAGFLNLVTNPSQAQPGQPGQVRQA